MAFYRFKIGDFQATVISDGYGQIPIWPTFAMSVSEAELAPVLQANFMQPVIQATNNMLVVDTGRERILVDTGFGGKIGPSLGRDGLKRGIVTLCIGGGQGIALAIETIA